MDKLGRKTGGRKPGQQNIITRGVKEVLAAIVNDNAEKASNMLDMIVDPDVWLRHYEKLVEYGVPKQGAVQMAVDSKQSDLRSELEDLANKEEELKARRES